VLYTQVPAMEFATRRELNPLPQGTNKRRFDSTLPLLRRYATSNEWPENRQPARSLGWLTVGTS
jgi:hypothetical protein